MTAGDRDDVPDEPPGTEVPGDGRAAEPHSSERDDPASPDPQLADLDRVVESDDDGSGRRATGDPG